MSLSEMSLGNNQDMPRKSAMLDTLADRFQTASHGNGVWVGAEESEYIAKIFKGYAELVDRLNGVWTKNV